MVQNLYTLKSLFTCREREICFIQQEFIKVPEQQRSSRTDTASIHLSWSKSGGGVESVGFSPRSLASQTKHITGCVFPHSAFEPLKFAARPKNVIFVPPPPHTHTLFVLQVRSIHGCSGAEKSIESFHVDPTCLESHEKIKICEH